MTSRRGRSGTRPAASSREPQRRRATGSGSTGPFSYAGGLFDAGDLLLEPFAAELGGEVRAPLGDPLDGAARLLERPPHFLDLIHETGAP